ncbi:CU044_5270 family protein [Streptomyces sp. NBC_00047]|uniref:CU044_5270 family protein n=1 Tax=Streptomyces sp. NBC_00047 TaxID=2975627 RepID=UPI002253C197|nr:CU044_5270 family protein [Streptomyces sp. NBC_00047]MCX5613582.1 CU044_5270 family protein [Streptomyces sp. NBC_00047]
MNANTSGPSPAEWDEGVRLLSQTARDLPAGRHQFHKELLMAQIQQEQRTETAAPVRARRFRLPRPAITLPVVATALAGAVVAVLMMPGGTEAGGLATGPAMTTPVGAATTNGVPELLDRISLAAAEVPQQGIKPGQYIYIESQTADTFLKTVGDKTTLASYELHRRQIWASPDGTKGWLIDPAVNDSPEGETLSLPDELGNTRVAGLNAPSYDYLAKLTADPDELLAKIYKETEGMGNSPEQQAFTTIGDLLGESYPPAALYPALFRAAAKIPGVVVVQDAVDAVGRPGVAVARLDENSGQREEWIFERNTHVFLGKRTVQVNENRGQQALIKPGTITFTSAITNRAIVDGIKRTPSPVG